MTTTMMMIVVSAGSPVQSRSPAVEVTNYFSFYFLFFSPWFPKAIGFSFCLEFHVSFLWKFSMSGFFSVHFSNAFSHRGLILDPPHI